MNSISIKINFQDSESLEFDSGYWSNRMTEWNLSSACLDSKKLQWFALTAEYIMSGEEFLSLVGANLEEAKKILLKNNCYLTPDDVEKHLPLSVKYFYRKIDMCRLIDVKFTIIDES